ncbi:hypothetical protein SAMN06265348_110280 [Pedobacter westerhofensis]|uniref:Uncharacterized protein n=1 Tax=Pedobacter westerhofensis TaxID=425512 RepID=A0A521F866_9SPHI|nr:hypothetical protein [Pedobacter westerhofensis]SMO92316.1 hypothetical protein SAMN06265348_110280 [Pedobacter westerhofensis]
MDMRRLARGTMIPTLTEWAYSSRMGKHLPKETCNLFDFGGTHSIHVDLTYLDKDYRKKYVETNFQKYCLEFVKQITPVLKLWAVKNNVNELNFILRFKAHYLYAAQIKLIINPEDRP